MVSRPLGRTGLRVSPIGFGAFKLGRNEGIKYPQPYDLPDDAQATTLLHAILDLGVTLVDTAPAYGLSEERVGAALAARRSEFVLSTKVGETFEAGRSTYDFSREAMNASVEASLRRLRTEAVDLLFLHAPREDVSVLRDTQAVETLLELRRRGLTRAVGFSGKTVEAARMALDWADALMVEYHSLDESHAGVMEDAARAGVGVVVKKGLASGRLPADAAVRFVLENRAVASLVIGSLRVEHLREAIAAADALDLRDDRS